MKKKFAFLFLPFFCAVLTWVGCAQPKPEGFPDLVSVTLVVLQEGKPLEGASISLSPIDAPKNWVIGGVSDASGKVSPQTYGTHAGAPIGKYKVVITKEMYEGLEEYQKAVAAQEEDPSAADKIKVKMFSCVEDKYTTKSTTPIEIEIVKSGQTIEIDAGKAVKTEKEFIR